MRSFWAKVDALEAWHAKLVDKPWLQPLKPTKLVIALILLSTVIAAGLNWYVRHWQYQVWEQNPEIFYLEDGTPLFTTTDAPYFLSISKELKKGGGYIDFREKRYYPNLIEKDVTQNTSLQNFLAAPLLSVVVSWLSEDSSPKELLRAANKLLPILSILGVLMVVIGLGVTGYWFSASVGGLGGALSYSFLTRTSAGRIDTDILNQGFFYLILGLAILAGRTKSFNRSILYTAAAGFVFWLFQWWYDKSVFLLIFLATLLWTTLISHREFKRTVLNAAVFVICSGMITELTTITFSGALVAETISQSDFIFPNTFETITELSKISIDEMFSRITGSFLLSVFAMLGLVFWSLVSPGTALAFSPAIAFLVLSIFIGNRTIFYSAPIIWFGLSWLTIRLMSSLIWYLRQNKSSWILVSSVTCVNFLIAWYSSPTNFLQSPSFDSKTIQLFKRSSKSLDQSKSVIITWWDYGYTSMFFNGLPTLHDGGKQNTPTTYFVAKSLMGRSQSEANMMLNSLANLTDDVILENLPLNENKFAFEFQNDGYLVLTSDMADWISSISQIGNWDIYSGRPIKFETAPADYNLGYELLECKQGDQVNQPLCNGNVLDLNTGAFGTNAVLDGIAIFRNGRQVSGTDFPNSTSAFMVHSELEANGGSNYLIHRDLYFSTFHQLFHAGKYDEKYFQLVLDNYPHSRVFKIVK